ncbi:hypothetical protein DCC62_31660, partial [candidate division KSB1 bacterium]
VLSLRTDAYRQAAAYLQKFDAPVLTQMSKNFYFYERKKSVEMRWQNAAVLDSIIQHSPVGLIAIDPIIHRFPQVEQWFKSQRNHLQLVHGISIQMYEPVYYQGFAPARLPQLPPTVAPFHPGRAKIEIFEWRNPR